MSGVRAFFRFWYDFVVGDDWRLALAAVAVPREEQLRAETGEEAGGDDQPEL